MTNHDFNLGMLLGRIASGQETVIGEVREIRIRLKDGDKRMDRIESDIHDLKNKKHPAGSVSSAERWAKQGAQWLIPSGVLWYTGSIDAAIKVMQALAGAAK